MEKVVLWDGRACRFTEAQRNGVALIRARHTPFLHLVLALQPQPPVPWVAVAGPCKISLQAVTIGQREMRPLCAHFRLLHIGWAAGGFAAVIQLRRRGRL